MTLNIAPTTSNTTITIAETKPKEPKSLKPSTLTRVLHHSHVTTDFDAHRFKAAAAQQLQPQQRSQETDTHLIASPYNSAAHLLDISALERQDRLFALALTYLKPTRADYATAGYTESFNWTEVFELLRAFSEAEDHTWKRRTYYVVIFRSVLLPDVDSDYLYALDAHSHREAMASGGLLKYWFGAKDGLERNLATCIWRNRDDARLGGQGPWHARARAAGSVLYEQIVFTTLGLTIGDGVESWNLSDWKEDAA
ncbi:hypothetical protein PENARI_c003G04177 [Penicillium arizonense]|uniref:Uncharacterized protein n=1 Tax=Penicillium arizonense TaxID=1835702 RepID=A0A1F5LTY8_PENAI|nr:hypothetical protein PENARI_c003G04177 [Penicillium arizonense]OGE56655.1 hypothetical protein PENARI_c003G04177 [Penicillium arizonense]